MKRILSAILVSVLIFTGCGKQVSNKELVAEQFKIIMKTNDSSTVRSSLSTLTEMIKDGSLSKEEKMFAQYTYNIAYGIAKLSMSGKSISVFDFPDMEILVETVSEVEKGNIAIDETILSESKKFVDRVEKFLQ